MTNALCSSERERRILSYRYLCKRGARKFLRPDVEPGDLEQIAALALIKACDRYDGSQPTPFEAYAWISIVGELMNHLRAHTRASRRFSVSPSVNRDVNITERIAFQGAIDALAPNERRIVQGIYACGLTQTAIAQRLSLSARHVARLHRRALDSLARRLAE